MAVVLALITLFQLWFEPPRRPPPKPTQPGVTAPVAGAPAAPSGAPAAVAVAPAPEEPPAPEVLKPLTGDMLKLAVSTHGGRVVEAVLPRFEDHRGLTRGQKGPPVDLATAGPDAGHLRLSFEGWSPTASYRVVEESPASLTLERESGSWRVRRSYQLDPQAYGLKSSVEITNLAAEPRTITPALEYTSRVREDEKHQGGFLSGGAPLDQHTFLCAGPEELWREAAVNLKAPHQHAGPVRWAGMDQQYFLAGGVTRDAPVAACLGKVEGQLARLTLNYAPLTVAPSATVKISTDGFYGPKQAEWLNRVDPQLEGAVDYGWFGILVRALLWLLLKFYSFIPNYGVAIFLLTLFVKLITLPLTQKSFVSMQRMKDLQPKIKEIQAKWAHDKAMQGQKQMELFKEENVSPLGGCLPILIQMPIWIALYRTLYTAVELYQQPFIPGWIEDLAQKDPYYVTPIALGVVMLIQTLLTPQTADNPQMKYVSYGMPIFFTFIMLALPAGLTLYMFFNTVLTIAQQLYIKRRFGGGERREGANPSAKPAAATPKR